jgi:microcystin-dependent protein
MDPFVGQLMCVGFNFAPKGYAFCDGKLQSIQQNAALFSLLGTTYGGDGRTTFALPDLRGRSPIGMGNGPGLNPVVQGEASGAQQVTLLTSQIPAHNHILAASNTATSTAPSGLVPATTNDTAIGAEVSAYGTATPGVTLAANACGLAGGNQPFSIMNPYLGLNWIIALQGIFPSRN